MSRNECTHAMDLIRALHDGEMDAPLRDHARACPDCSAVAKMAVWMNHLAAETPKRELPEATILRLKAQLFGRTPAELKVLQPVRLLQRIAFGVIALCWAALLTWKWEAVANFSFDRAFTSAIAGASPSPSLIAIVFTLGCATILITVQTALAE